MNKYFILENSEENDIRECVEKLQYYNMLQDFISPLTGT